MFLFKIWLDMVSVFEGELKKWTTLDIKEQVKVYRQQNNGYQIVEKFQLWLKYYILRYMFKKDQMDEYRQIKVQ